MCMKKRRVRDLDAKNRKYNGDLGKNRQAAQKRNHDKKQPIKQYKKQKYPVPKPTYHKVKYKE